MISPHRYRMLPKLGLHAVLLCALLAVVWLGGGASRGNALGQVLVRGAAAAALIVAVLFGDGKVQFPAGRPVLLLLVAAIILPLLQLVPLPPAVWEALPGRAVFRDASGIIGHQVWRPWSIVPGGTLNALLAMIVPFGVWFLAAEIPPDQRAWLPGALLGLAVISTVVGLLQFSGAGLDNPLVNDTPGEVSGMFANRNHFALSLAIGCLLVPGWVFREGHRPHWRGVAGIALLLLFGLMILASGSRAGMGLGVLSLLMCLCLSWQGLRKELRRHPRWLRATLIIGAIAFLVGFVTLSIAADRAVSVNRSLAIATGEDMRSLGLPTVLTMIGEYFPSGSGLGCFDPLFRLHEPMSLLKYNYFNHAHNDYLEIILEAGLPGLLLLLAALTWWAIASVAAWRSIADPRYRPARVGSAIVLLVLVASLVDYPARTPFIMAILVIAAIWLQEAPGRQRSALPDADQAI